MSDFGDEEYKNMICVEAGYVYKRYLLQPNQNVKMGQSINV
jgi:glucose-6-phosphate 1-epimerase